MIIGGRGLPSPAADTTVMPRVTAAHGKSAQQVVLRWMLSAGVGAVPPTVTRRGAQTPRLAQGLGVFDFNLTATELLAIDGLALGSDKPAPDL